MHIGSIMLEEIHGNIFPNNFQQQAINTAHDCDLATSDYLGSNAGRVTNGLR